VDDPFFGEFYKLYSNSFPASERRSWGGLDLELKYEKRFCAHALIQNDQFVGLFNYWTFDRFFYVEHLDISPAFRNQKIGSNAMEIFKNQVSLPIVIEVEMPSNSEAINRIRFYEDLGFKVISHYYAQPPYEGTAFLLPMILMSSNYHFANTHFELIKNTLYNDVYHFES